MKELSLNRNKLASGEGIVGLKQLVKLDIQENDTLTHLGGMSDLPSLTSLSCAKSALSTLDNFPNLPALEDLNLDGAKFEKVDEFAKLCNLKSLKTISAAECEKLTEGGADVRKEITIALMDDLPALKTVNGEPLDEDYLKECKEEKQERIRAAAEAAKAALENPEGEKEEDD